MKQYLLYLWNKIPPKGKIALHGLYVSVEAAIGSAVVGYLLQWASSSQPPCFTKACFTGAAVGVVGAVVVAIRNWIRQSAATTLEQYKAQQ